MKDKTGSMLCRLAEAVLLAGGIIVLIGLYYWIVKAGIPYQDPPLELQIRYAVNDAIGMTLLAAGFKTAFCGGALRLLLWLAGKKRPNG
ncbi:MAG: hypothetical protein HDT26_11735 [Subdoligranulum sp.]|nr:hypothetical protein [Subdoligranulum sp.]